MAIRDSMKNKSRAIILVFIILLFIFTYSLNKYNKEQHRCDNIQQSYLDFSIYSNKSILSNNETDFYITFILKNNRTKATCIHSELDIGATLYVNLKGPMGSIKLISGQAKMADSKEYLNEKKEVTINVAQYNGLYTIQNQSGKYIIDFNWDIEGQYTITATYHHVYSNIEIDSNELMFIIQL
ncbi:unnamed protein product [marine sediment metagenome]|uniref:Uncharacterized protein n=1 Tax=marine sediment metagenome TaxID=412755 RepID=X0W4Y0_9ZZZZ